MKKILLVALLSIPFMLSAKKEVDAKYLRGAVPEVNGIVTFSEDFSVPGKSQDEIYQVMYKFVQDSIIGRGIKGERTSIISDGKEDGTIVARNEEYIVFRRSAFNLDRTRFRYHLIVKTSDEKVHMELTKITYYYNEDAEGKKGLTYKAEEWISDKEAVNKSNTRLYPRCGKFRIKTVDRVESVFAAAKNSFEGSKAPVQRTRVINSKR